ncbi:MAG: glycosyltransferase family 2 protein [Acidobacteriota bacterium]|jgi:glycosyltransferase involved in cell wall biosynthesis|nr:glycosyltransferase family 2 protein [Acidobacteriota bacterium]
MKQNLNNKIDKTLVSIIIPFFNREDFLGEAVESVLAQTYENWELFLVDDGSTDKSFHIAEKFVKKYPDKIYLLTHENNENKGASASRNLGIKYAKGEFITFLDSDDIYFPDTLEKELKAFAENIDADAVCGTLECWYSWSDEADEREKDFKINLVLELEELYQPPDLLIHNLNASGRKPGINCVMLKREFVEQVGNIFEDDCRYVWEDQVFWAKVSLFGKIYVMDATLAKYRQHPASSSAVETHDGSDIPSMNIFLDWLENYLQEQKIKDERVWKALRNFQRNLRIETKLKRLKQLYRRTLPLHIRYGLRDKWTKLKKWKMENGK